MNVLDWVATIAVIIVAIFELVLLGLLIAIAFVAWKLLGLVRSDLPPILGSVKKTATTVEGTADFMSTTAAAPLISVVSFVFAALRFLQVLLSAGGPSRERQP
jgi:hypothetical protein